ncbi:MAG: alpha-amylase family glycosyl hydrolase [Cyclobacteriaceae bacterium]
MERPIIYQILVRLFGNLKKPKKKWGALSENGVGKMNDISDKALSEIKKMGFNHVWFTGLIEHATCTDYSKQGIASDHPSVVKGVAGSPYAIKDYYDIAPDLAENVAERMNEFLALIDRTHQNGLKAIIDFVPNHLARQYHSDAKPKAIKDFGEDDDPGQAFLPSNNFYYIPDRELLVPESTNNHTDPGKPYVESPAKATGNDVFTHQPSINDWYETVKLNYGVDYLNEKKEHFNPIPNTWIKMKEILSFWVKKGVDGFRCDMAEMVPVAFWNWVIKEIKSENPEVLFIAEVYQPHQYRRYIHDGGFDFLYDKVDLYDTLKAIIQGHQTTDRLPGVWQAQEGIIDQMLRFLENHDEQRINSPFFAGSPLAGIPMMAATSFMHRGPIMIYFGQEVGEPAKGESGFSGDDGRTTLFDYWNVPEHQKWMNGGSFDGGKLSKDQSKLRQKYIEILKACNEEQLLRTGQFYDLQYYNRSMEYSGYSDKTYAFIRHDQFEGILVIINFGDQPAEVELKIPIDFFRKLGLDINQKILIDRSQFDISSFANHQSDQVFSEKLPPYSYKFFKILSSQ